MTRPYVLHIDGRAIGVFERMRLEADTERMNYHGGHRTIAVEHRFILTDGHRLRDIPVTAGDLPIQILGPTGRYAFDGAVARYTDDDGTLEVEVATQDTVTREDPQ